LISDSRLESFISFNKLIIARTTNYLILILFFRIYSKKSIVKRLEISKLISFAIMKIDENANKKEMKIIKVIRITITIKIAIVKIAIKTKIVATIVNNDLFLQEYAKIANVIMKTRHTIIVTKQIINDDVASTIIREIVKTLS
jgi:hypothetical protein